MYLNLFVVAQKDRCFFFFKFFFFFSYWSFHSFFFCLTVVLFFEIYLFFFCFFLQMRRYYSKMICKNNFKLLSYFCFNFQPRFFVCYLFALLLNDNTALEKKKANCKLDKQRKTKLSVLSVELSKKKLKTILK